MRLTVTELLAKRDAAVSRLAQTSAVLAFFTDTRDDFNPDTVRDIIRELAARATLEARTVAAWEDVVSDAIANGEDDRIVQTSCRWCGLDIEGDRASNDWRDRGNNARCSVPRSEDDAEHEPAPIG